MSCLRELLDGVMNLTTWISSHYYVVLASTSLVMGLYGYSALKRSNRRKRWNSAGKDVVVLHTIYRGKTSPSITPFAIKLETFFRMCKIKYELEFDEPMGPKGKIPWITLNGEDLTDSELIISHLKKKYGYDLSSHLTKEQKAVASALQRMVDEHLYWGSVHWRYVEDKDTRAFTSEVVGYIPWYSRPFIGLMRRKLWKQVWIQGLGRHSNEEIRQFMREDLQALSDYLGEKPYFMGNDPTEVDCAIFGELSQLIWNAPGSPYLPMMQGNFRNLLDFCYRMKEKYWPDWTKS